MMVNVWRTGVGGVKNTSTFVNFRTKYIRSNSKLPFLNSNDLVSKHFIVYFVYYIVLHIMYHELRIKYLFLYIVYFLFYIL